MKMPEYWILRLFNGEFAEITYDEYIKIPVDVSYDAMYRNVKHMQHVWEKYAKKSEILDEERISQVKLISYTISLLYGYESLNNEDYGWDIYENNQVKGINLSLWMNDCDISASYLSNNHIFYYYRPHNTIRQKEGVPDVFTLPEKNEIIGCFDFIQEIYSEKYKAEFPIRKSEWVLKITNFMYVKSEKKNAKFVVFPDSITFDKIYKTIGYFQYLNFQSIGRKKAKIIKTGTVPDLNLWFVLNDSEISNLLVDVLGAKLINEDIYKSLEKEIRHEIDLEENWHNAMEILKSSKDENGYPDYCVPNALKHLYKIKYFYDVMDGNGSKDKYIEMYNKHKTSKKPTLLFKK